ncbi:MAG: histidine phosphatase family protein [Rubrobacter sp.]|nr:histidine phosphatase family protein [Rubrobacter sp.]
MPERTLILVKHARPEILPELPPNRWRLSDEGRRDCAALAKRLREYAPSVIVSSEEPKAIETARIVAERMDVNRCVHHNLHEHDRTGAPFGTEAEFRLSARKFFRNPETLVWGNETAAQARDRFTGAIDAVLQQYRESNVVVVTHGTVISLFIAQHSDIEGYELWLELGLASFCVLSLPEFELRNTIRSATQSPPLAL